MEATNIIKEYLAASKASKMSLEQIYQLQTERLNKLVNYARENSPLYRDIYSGLEENPSLETLPVTNKALLSEKFDDWLTDPKLSLSKVEAFIEDPENIGKFLDNKCVVAMTSGATGKPCKILIDKKSWNVMNGLHYSRLFGFKDLIKLGLKGGKYFTIANPTFSSSYSAYRNQVLPNQLNKFRCRAVKVDTPTAKIVKELNKFKPSILFAYPTVMQLLLPHIKSGNLKIDPDIIVLGGETCFPELKEELEENFTARILNAYACTEANMITTQCSEGRLHINIDWVIIEAVDVNNNPVAKGVLSDKVLLTNLSNFLQPIIRYELTDRIAIYDEPCKCGSVMPYLYVEGRSNDMLEFEGVEGLVEISPMALGILGKVTGLIQYQIIQKSHHLMELRL